MRVVALGLVASAIATLTAGGCGGSLSEPVAPADSVGSAVQEVDAAEARIGAALGAQYGAGGDATPQIVPPDTPTPTTTAEVPTPTTKPPIAQPGPTAQANEEDRCRVACDALTSMLRAVDRLCTITGQTDERCQSRRARADSASTRVVQSCPSCNV